jgi:lipopolysaccharide heptosyltransferase I
MRAVTPPRSILIVRLSALGDAVHVLPALTALREAFPAAKIGWAVENKASTLLVGQPQLDRVHLIPRQELTEALKGGRLVGAARYVRRLVRDIRRKHYDVAIDFQSNLRSSVVTFVSGAPRRIGQPSPFAKEGSGLFYTDTPDPVAPSVHKIDRNLALLAPLGVQPAAAPRGVVGGLDSAHLEEALARQRAGAAPLVLVHAGVSPGGAVKAWREERFAALAKALAGDGATVLFLWGGAREQRQAQRLMKLAAGVEIAPPTVTILELAWLLRQADLFVGVDSGPLHLAATLGTRVLGLYGPKHPGTYGPYWPGSRIVRSGEHCSPCPHRRCPQPNVVVAEIPGEGSVRLSPCMESLTVDMALAEARAILAMPA